MTGMQNQTADPSSDDARWARRWGIARVVLDVSMILLAVFSLALLVFDSM